MINKIEVGKLLVIALISTFTGCSGTSTATPSKIHETEKSYAALLKEPTPRPKTDSEYRSLTQAIDVRGVKLQNKIPAVTGIEAITKPAYYLEEADHKPDNVVPEFTSIRFHGDYAKRHEESFFSPEINIYPIDEFRVALGKSKNAVTYFDDQITLLRKIVSDKPSELKKVPSIPLGDGSPIIVTHLRYRRFTDCEGVSYLTHFDIEPSLIGNDRLTYVFQGITLDERYYIFATFPVTLGILPSSNASHFRDYEMPLFFYDPKTRKINEANFERYLNSMKILLENTPATKFEPSLTYIDETLETLKAAYRD